MMHSLGTHVTSLVGVSLQGRFFILHLANHVPSIPSTASIPLPNPFETGSVDLPPKDPVPSVIAPRSHRCDVLQSQLSMLLQQIRALTRVYGLSMALEVDTVQVLLEVSVAAVASRVVEHVAHSLSTS